MTVTELAYRLTADSTGLSREMSVASRDVRRFSRRAESNIRRAGRAFSVFAGVAAGALAKLIKDSIDTGTELSLLSDRTGMAVESLSSLAWAAEQSDTNIEAVSSALNRLNGQLGRDEGGQYEQRLRRLGVTVRDVNGDLLEGEDLLKSVADAFVEADSQAERAAIGTEAFGRGWTEIAPLLAEGRDGIEDLQQEAERLGLVMSQDAADGSRQLGDNINILRARARGFGNAMAASVLPILVNYTTEVANAAKETDGLNDNVTTVTRVVGFAMKAIEGLNTTVRLLAAGIAATGALAVSEFMNMLKNVQIFARGVGRVAMAILRRDFASLGRITQESRDEQERREELHADARLAIVDSFVEDRDEILANAAARFAAIDKGMLGELVEGAEVASRDTNNSLTGPGGITDAINEIDEEFEALSRKMASNLARARTPMQEFGDELRDLWRAFELGIISEQQFDLLEARLEEALDPQGVHAARREAMAIAEAEAQRMEELVNQAARVRMEIQGIDLRTRAHLESLQELLDEGLLTWQEYELAVRQVSGALEEGEDQAARYMDLVQQGVGTLADTLIDGIVDPLNASWEDMASNFIRQITRMVLQTAAQRAILAAFGGGVGFSEGGLVQGFASGGYVSGPGTSTSDSIPARLSAGEYVMPASSVDRFGVGFFESIRKGLVPGFASGGLVQRPGTSGGGTSGGPMSVKVVVVSNEREAALEALRSPAGEQVIIEKMQRLGRDL